MIAKIVSNKYKVQYFYYCFLFIIFLFTARVSGVPHFVALDGLLYTFNAVGEFIAIANGNFTLQLRLEQYGNSRGRYKCVLYSLFIQFC